MEQVITVGLGEVAVSGQSEAVLVAFGLGSCVGVTAYDPVRKVGGLLHAMLPQRRNGDKNLTKYVDSGIPELLSKLLALGAKREQLLWRYAGGAQMLTAPGLSDRFNIGAQNVVMTQEVMGHYLLRVLSQDTGGYQGRTVRLFIADGRVLVRGISGSERQL
ncbi:MAG: chemotaxis protein CheD [Anaerolineae bacterium]|nr:chemotaxis protein CheD [Anaerolineae bacterium]